MGTFLSESVPVSLAGSLGDAGNFKLFKCDQPNLILYVAKQPRLMLDRAGKPAVAVTIFNAQQPDHSVKIIGGAGTICLNTAPELDQAAIDEAKARLAPLGYDPGQMRFLPLTTQKGMASLNLVPTAGEPDKKHNEADVGAPGATLSFLTTLTEFGALEWANGVRNKEHVSGDIMYRYEYLRRVPDIGAKVHVHGTRVFEHLSAALDVSYNGFFYGGSAKLEAAWDALQRNGGIEIEFLNAGGLPPELEALRIELVSTFVKQGMAILFDQIFAPMPQVAPAQAAHGGGLLGGANFALKWQKKTDAVELTQEIWFKGTAWLTDNMNISLAELFADLDPSCLTEVPAQQAFDSVIVVDADPLLTSAAVAMSWEKGGGHTPEAPVFNKDGGEQRYTVVSTAPDAVKVNCTAKISYAPPRWPVIPFSMSQTVQEGGQTMKIKTSAWVGRQTIFMFVRDGNRIVPPQDITPDDYLVLNVSYSGPHLPDPVRDSAHIDALTPIEFAYPLDPQGRPGVAKFSAFGVIGGKLVRAPEQVIPQEDTACFILATRGGNIQLVTSKSELPEADELAQTLRQLQGRPVFPGAGSKPGETTRKGPGQAAGTGPGTGPGYGAGKILTGRTAGVEYGAQGTSLWLRLPDGTSKRIRLHSIEESIPFEKESKLVKVQVDASGEYAENIFVDLVGA
jgi:hypothetical protein